MKSRNPVERRNKITSGPCCISIRSEEWRHGQDVLWIPEGLKSRLPST